MTHAHHLAATTDKTIIIPDHGQPASNRSEIQAYRDMIATKGIDIIPRLFMRRPVRG